MTLVRENKHDLARGQAMGGQDFNLATYYPIFFYLVVLIGFALTTLVIAHGLGPRRETARKHVPYESGMDPVGDARQRFDIKFYLVAIMFLVFDVELLFLYPWAVVAYQNMPAPSNPAGGLQASTIPMIPPELKLPVFLCVLTFVALLFLAYLYDWKKGVFRWR